MRNLHLYRERALACFALKYHYFVNANIKDIEALLSSDGNRMEHWLNNPDSLRNGERVVLEIPDEDTGLFIAVITENKILLSNEVDLPCNISEPAVKVITDFDGYHRLQVRCVLENA